MALLLSGIHVNKHFVSFINRFSYFPMQDIDYLVKIELNIQKHYPLDGIKGLRLYFG